MNYALTVEDYIITGVHESLILFGPWTFEKNPALCNDKIVIVKEPGQYRKGIDIRCFEADGTMKDAVWCIEQGYMKLPPNTEILDGKLVNVIVPEPEAEPSVKEILISLRSELAGLKETVTAQAETLDRIALKVDEPVKPVEPIEEVIK